MPRENDYILLELDPDRDTTWPAIEPKLKKKKSEWAQLSVSHPRKDEYKQLLEESPEREQRLKDDALRSAEAKEAKLRIEARRAEIFAELDAKFSLIQKKGYATPQELKLWVAQGGKRWQQLNITEADVLALAAKRGVAVRQPPPPLEPLEPPDPRIEEIHRKLKIIEKLDLYDLLDAPRTSSAKTLKDLADRKYEEVRNLPKDAGMTVTQELVGDCQVFFATEVKRQKYDNSLRWLELGEIRAQAETAGVGEGKISAAASEELILRGKKQNLERDRVIAAIREVAERRKWLLEIPSEAATAAYVRRCGRCLELAIESAVHCKCGRLLKVECPRCKTVNPSDAMTCGKPGCAFETGDMFRAERSLRDAKGLFHAEPGRARALLNDALIFWPGHPDAVTLLGDLARREEEARRAAEAIEQEVRRAAGVIEGLFKSRNFHASEKAIDELARLAPGHPRLPAFRREASDAIASAKSLAKQARDLEQQSKSDDALDKYTLAVHTCEDHADAKAGLSRCPPDPPAMPSFRANASGVTLSWRNSPSRGRLTYRVVRKIGSQPTRPDDGDPLGETSVSPFTDQSAEPGRAVYYAIFTDRERIPSARPAVVGPVVRVAEVSGLKTGVGDGKVELSWSPPPNARGVEIWRSSQAVPKAGEGSRLTGIHGNSAIDQGLINDTNYGYRVVAVFNGGDGRPLLSEGVGCVACPLSPPKPVTDLRAYRTKPGYFEASWNPSAKGDVRVYRIADPRALRVRTNQQVTIGEVDALGERLKSASANTVLGALGEATELHLLPVTLLKEAAVVGQLVSTNWVDDVDRLKAWADGGSLRANWDYPSGFDLAFIAYRTDRFPEGPNDPNARVVRWAREQSRLNGGFHCPVPGAERVYLTVYTTVNRNGQPYYSVGKQIEVAVKARRRVRYKVMAEKKMLLATGRWLVVLKAEARTTLPELVLVGKSDGYPLSPMDGHEVLRAKSQECLPASSVLVPFYPPPGFEARNARLFPADDQESGWLELVRES